MRRVSRTVALFAALSCCASVAAQNTPYNPAETFQPGKKYNCVPTADRKSWNCNEIGKAESSSREPEDQPAPPAQPGKSDAAAAPPPAPVSNAERSTSLPSYLTNAAASSNAPPAPPPSTISATANRANAPTPAQIEQRMPPPKPAPVATKPPHAETPHPAALKNPAPAPIRETPPTPPSAGGDFMDLAGDRFVIELAHASRPSELAAARDAMRVPHGELYELHFRQNGADAWLLLWGSFDSIEAARAARSELAQSTSAAVGWPRRVAPLQAEARRVSP